MSVSNEDIRALIARQAADWFVAQREGNLGADERRAFDEWLLASPVHVEEYLGMAGIALALPTAADDPECPLDGLMERARLSDEAEVRPLHTSPVRSPTNRVHRPLQRRWQLAAASVLAVVMGAAIWWNTEHPGAQRYATNHGEQRAWPLPDRSVLRLNTDTAVTVRYSPAERLIEINHGQAYFEVAHEPARRFRVVAGTTNIVAVGTQFDVFRDRAVTLVTVVTGRVLVSSSADRHQTLQVDAGEQVRVTGATLPDHASPVDAQRSIAWLRRQIVFDQEPLALVVAEFNRYGPVPIDIESPSLQGLRISGVFASDDLETFIAFLRTLDDVTVEATAARIRVFRSAPTPTGRPEGP